MTKMLKVVGASWLQTKISSYVLGALGLLAIVALFLGELERIQDDGNYAATVFYSEKSGYRIEYWGQSNELANVPRGVARAYYRQDIDTTGWAQLEIETDPSYKDKVQAYAAGLLEGALTWQTVHAHLQSTVEAECARAEKDCERVKDELERAASIDKNNAAKYEDDDPFWHQVGLFYDQIAGIYTGWKYGVERSQKEYEIEIADLYWLNAMSEIREIKKNLNITIKDDVNEYLPGLSSAFLKIVNATVTKDNISNVRKKLFVAHNTAGNYNSMIRILKRYQLNYHETDTKGSPLVAGTAVQFSGYPAAVTSHDDMFILSGGDRLMAVTGTTINNFNKELWRKVNIIEQVPIGPRISAANRLASNVSSWVHILARNNSGTACKQWMVVDLKLLNKPVEKPVGRHFRTVQTVDRARNTREIDSQTLDNEAVESETSHVQNVQNTAAVHENTDHAVVYTTKNSDVKHTIVHRGSSRRVKGLFWLLEQVPGYAHSGDLSDALLDQGYWATYGLPFFKDIADHTHLPEKETQFGDIFSYTNSPRAAIFREASKNATTFDNIVHFMRNNNMTLLSHSEENFSSNEIVDISKSFDKTNGAVVADKVKCDDGSIVKDKMECVMNERQYWMNLAVRGDLASQYQEAFGVIDTKVFSGDANGIDDLAVISGPTYTPAKFHKNSTSNPINKGNVALASKRSDSNSNSLIRDQVTDPANDEAQVIQPFQWSTSKFSDVSHKVQPDKFAFQPFRPTWVW